MKKQTKTEGVRYAQTYPLLIYPYVIAFSLLLNHAITLLFHNSKRSMQHTTRDCNKKNARWRKEHNIRTSNGHWHFVFGVRQNTEKKTHTITGTIKPLQHGACKHNLLHHLIFLFARSLWYSSRAS